MLHLVVGTRPEIVQAFPLARVASDLGIDLRVVVVTQHTDAVMSSDVLPESITNTWERAFVDVAPFSIGRCIQELTEYLLAEQPTAVIVIGDTDTALAAAIAASEARIPVAHVEAGLRSHDWAMKEERNRTLIDHLAAISFPPTVAAEDRLRLERVHGRIERTGDVHVDAFRLLEESGLLTPSPDYADTYVATIHRRENIVDPARLEQVCALLQTADRPVRLLLHPHTRLRVEAAGLTGLLAGSGPVRVADPLPFLPFVRALAASSGVITDSGGVQKQAYLLGVPCLTLRTSTEWTETLSDSWNVLLDPAGIDRLPTLNRPTTARTDPFGDGHAARRIMEAAAGL